MEKQTQGEERVSEQEKWDAIIAWYHDKECPEEYKREVERLLMQQLRAMEEARRVYTYLSNQ